MHPGRAASVLAGVVVACTIGSALTWPRPASPQSRTQNAAQTVDAGSTAPAGSVTGCWTGSMQFGFLGRVPVRFRLDTTGGALRGTFQGPTGSSTPIENGRVESGRIEFEVPARHGRMRFVATVEPARLHGHVHVARQGRLPFDAQRCESSRP